VEVAARAENESDPRIRDDLPHLGKQALIPLSIEGVAGVSVRCADNVSDSVVGGNARHLEGGGEIR
jgi:hypothetical protein